MAAKAQLILGNVGDCVGNHKHPLQIDTLLVEELCQKVAVGVMDLPRQQLVADQKQSRSLWRSGCLFGCC